MLRSISWSSVKQIIIPVRRHPPRFHLKATNYFLPTKNCSTLHKFTANIARCASLNCAPARHHMISQPPPRFLYSQLVSSPRRVIAIHVASHHPIGSRCPAPPPVRTAVGRVGGYLHESTNLHYGRRSGPERLLLWQPSPSPRPLHGLAVH